MPRGLPSELTWILPWTPVLSIRLATLTVFPQMSYTHLSPCPGSLPGLHELRYLECLRRAWHTARALHTSPCYLYSR